MSSYSNNIEDVNLQIDGEIYSVSELLEVDYSHGIQELCSTILALSNYPLLFTVEVEKFNL